MGHDPEEIPGVEETDRVAGSDGGAVQGLGQEGLAHTGGPHQQDMLVPAEEFQGENLV